MDDTEGDLIERARQGDRDALDALLRRHAEAVLTHAKHRIDPRWQTHLTPEDVLQITCIEALCHIGSFVPRESAGSSSFVHWLKRIAENNIIDVARGLQAENRRRPRAGVMRFGRMCDASMSLLQALVPAGTRSGPSRHLSTEEAKRALEWALEQLPIDHRQVVEWYDIEGRSIASIAEELGRTPGATYMMRTRAHNRLRVLLAPKAQIFFTHP